MKPVGKLIESMEQGRYLGRYRLPYIQESIGVAGPHALEPSRPSWLRRIVHPRVICTGIVRFWAADYAGDSMPGCEWILRTPTGGGIRSECRGRYCRSCCSWMKNSPRRSESAGLKVLRRSKIGMTGQNLVWVTEVTAGRGLLENDADLVATAYQRIADEIRVEYWGGHSAGLQFPSAWALLV